MPDITAAGTTHYQCSEYCERAPLHDGPCDPAPDRLITSSIAILEAMQEALEMDNFPRFLTQLRHLKRRHADLWKWAVKVQDDVEEAVNEIRERGERWW